MADDGDGGFARFEVNKRASNESDDASVFMLVLGCRHTGLFDHYGRVAG